VSRLANDGEPALSSSSVPSGNGRARFYVSTTRGLTPRLSTQGKLWFDAPVSIGLADLQRGTHRVESRVRDVADSVFPGIIPGPNDKVGIAVA
jgi:hypothetical protein